MWWLIPVGLGLLFVGKRLFGSSSNYDLGYRDGRAGDPIGMSLWEAGQEPPPDSCWVDNPETWNRNLENDYCRGFFDGQEDRIAAGD